ncbi:hypothetical protein FVE85_3163 [Porphyridium purpureum]|uniref:Retinoblastoma-associated protein A-box domain-containing protein n=1 Tax=Porphyridium purpureum TaxID=35688 RepID=A0A5J4YVP0_PORPP|nr:hypothetical protein FVE85_3163 [Porphyridium purpureum]|eukprot:POR2911..scf227_4
MAVEAKQDALLRAFGRDAAACVVSSASHHHHHPRRRRAAASARVASQETALMDAQESGGGGDGMQKVDGRLAPRDLDREQLAQQFVRRAREFMRFEGLVKNAVSHMSASVVTARHEQVEHAWTRYALVSLKVTGTPACGTRGCETKTEAQKHPDIASDVLDSMAGFLAVWAKACPESTEDASPVEHRRKSRRVELRLAGECDAFFSALGITGSDAVEKSRAWVSEHEDLCKQAVAMSTLQFASSFEAERARQDEGQMLVDDRIFVANPDQMTSSNWFSEVAALWRNVNGRMASASTTDSGCTNSPQAAAQACADEDRTRSICHTSPLVSHDALETSQLATLATLASSLPPSPVDLGSERLWKSPTRHDLVHTPFLRMSKVTSSVPTCTPSEWLDSFCGLKLERNEVVLRMSDVQFALLHPVLCGSCRTTPSNGIDSNAEEQHDAVCCAWRAMEKRLRGVLTKLAVREREGEKGHGNAEMPVLAEHWQTVSRMTRRCLIVMLCNEATALSEKVRASILAKLVESDALLRAVIAIAVQVVHAILGSGCLSSYSGAHNALRLVDALQIDTLDFCKIVKKCVNACLELPRVAVEQLASFEAVLLDARAWAAQSALMVCLLMPSDEAQTRTIRDTIWDAAHRVAKRRVMKVTPVAFGESDLSVPPYHIAGTAISIFKCVFKEQLTLLQGRRLDQILLCCTAAAAACLEPDSLTPHGLPGTLEKVIQAYETTCQSSGDATRSSSFVQTMLETVVLQDTDAVGSLRIFYADIFEPAMRNEIQRCHRLAQQTALKTPARQSMSASRLPGTSSRLFGSSPVPPLPGKHLHDSVGAMKFLGSPSPAHDGVAYQPPPVASPGKSLPPAFCGSTTLKRSLSGDSVLFSPPNFSSAFGGMHSFPMTPSRVPLGGDRISAGFETPLSVERNKGLVYNIGQSPGAQLDHMNSILRMSYEMSRLRDPLNDADEAQTMSGWQQAQIQPPAQLAYSEPELVQQQAAVEGNSPRQRSGGMSKSTASSMRRKYGKHFAALRSRK